MHREATVWHLKPHTLHTRWGRPSCALSQLNGGKFGRNDYACRSEACNLDAYRENLNFIWQFNLLKLLESTNFDRLDKSRASPNKKELQQPWEAHFFGLKFSNWISNRISNEIWFFRKKKLGKLSLEIMKIVLKIVSKIISQSSDYRGWRNAGESDFHR